MLNTRRKISIIMVFVLTLFTITQNITYADSLRDKIEDEVRKEYENDAEFLRETKDKGEKWSEEYINKIVDRRIEKLEHFTINSDPDAIQQVSISDIQQTTEYNCGPTNALMLLYTAGRASLVQGSTDSEKINTLSGSSYCDTDSSGSYVYKVKDTINAFMPSAKKNYVYTYINSKSTFIGNIHESLRQGYAAIMHADASLLPYWDGYGGGHYISVYYINSNTDSNIIKVSDSYNGYYCKNSPYLKTFGKHNVSINDAYNATRNRYLISYE